MSAVATKNVGGAERVVVSAHPLATPQGDLRAVDNEFVTRERRSDAYRSVWYQELKGGVGIQQIPLFSAIIESRAFQRLRNIRFLGAIDYSLIPHPNEKDTNRRHTRFEHSIRVGALALSASRVLGLDKKRSDVFVASALLHDIGHAPLSHSMEPMFKRYFGIDHHSAGLEIIRGDSPFGREIINILNSYDVDCEDVVSTLNGDSDDIFMDLMSGPINLDTIEAITRCYRYCSKNNIEPPAEVIMLAAIRRDSRDIAILDRFWALKNDMYKYLINSKIGIISDMVCNLYFQRYFERFSRNDYFCDEVKLRNSHRDLFNLLEGLNSFDAITTILSMYGTSTQSVSERAFWVDSSRALSFADARYRRSKSNRDVYLWDFLHSQIDKWSDIDLTVFETTQGQLALE
jgi:putative nucleotidyltransferase with HDIG domain